MQNKTPIHATRILLVALLAAALTATLHAEDWPQFRGPGASGVSPSLKPLPVRVGPEESVLWKKKLPAGHSSPAIHAGRLFLTGVDGEELVTMAIDCNTGEMLWKQPAPHVTKEKIHTTGSLAQSSPAADSEVVISFFGSSGLLAWNPQGKLLWSQKMGPFRNDFGAGSSPVIDGNRVILVQDHDEESFIAVFDKLTGRELWRKQRPEFLRNYATPVIWNVAGRKQVVVLATLRITAYDLESGDEVWTCSGVSRIINMTPVIGDDNTLYAACFSPGNDTDDRVVPLTIEQLFNADADGNGTIEEPEFPDHPFRGRFSQLDRNKDGHLTKAEYEVTSRPHVDGRNVVLAITPGGTGDITSTHVRWEHLRQIPYCPSPLFYRGALLMVKNGGIMTVLDAATGSVRKQKRLRATADYFASPIAGDGKVYLLNVNGELTVLQAETWEELHTVSLDADGHATPAIADGRLFVRAGEMLYCFGTATAAE
ncbi:MAG: PQQ-binding-like beta-propeller repeat protein [Planctomycetaceae bacterium]